MDSSVNKANFGKYLVTNFFGGKDTLEVTNGNYYFCLYSRGASQSSHNITGGEIIASVISSKYFGAFIVKATSNTLVFEGGGNSVLAIEFSETK